MKRALPLLALAFLLSACEAPGIRPGAIPEPGSWRFAGKVGFRGPDFAESANINWQQCPREFHIRLTGPLGGSIARVDGEHDRVRVQIEGEQPRVAGSASALLRQELGWDLPVEALRWWLRGEPAPGAAARRQRDGGQLTGLTQYGWQVDYLDWHRDAELALPAKLKLSDGELTTTVLIKRWLPAGCGEG